MEDPSPLPSGAMRLYEENLCRKLPRCWEIFLSLLAASLELLKLLGKVVGEIAMHSRIPDERVDILTHEVCWHTLSLHAVVAAAQTYRTRDSSRRRLEARWKWIELGCGQSH
jgi:hypothetical protein